MSDERRERYRTAIVKASYISPLSSFAAEAAMAVADAEISRAVGDRAALVLENARLRAELEQKQADHADALQSLIKAGRTIERVRAVSDQYPKAPWLHGPSIRAALEGES
ncbi:hypothetical protein [Streptomyces nigrescens]|uniref:hypothetical protein n=1 Tax=Streptomyces nigrescens TaxID=1920 RepID=UPI00382C63EA